MLNRNTWWQRRNHCAILGYIQRHPTEVVFSHEWVQKRLSQISSVSHSPCVQDRALSLKTVTAHGPDIWNISQYGTVLFLCRIALILKSTSTSLFVKMNEMGALHAVVRQACFVLHMMQSSYVRNNIAKRECQYTVYTSEERHVNCQQHRRSHTSTQ